MKERLAAVIADLRAAGVRVSVAEAIDAACAAAVVGVERAALADALAAAIVKDEGDRALFDECFARVFPAAPPRAATTAGARRRRAKGATSEGGGLHGRSDGDAGGAGAVAARDDDPDTDADGGAAAAADRESSMRSTARGANSRDDDNDRADHAVNSRDDEHDLADHAANSRHDDGDAADRRDGAAACSDDADPQRAVLGADRSRDVASESANAGAARAKAARIRALRTMAFVAMSPHDVEEASALVRVLAQRVSTRLRRRLRPQPRGRLDFRRTLRAATPRGGVPLERYFRGRRPRPPALVALCDLSASVATATDFFLALLAPAAAWFRDVRLYGFVDRLVEIEFAAGQIRPAAPLDLMCWSSATRGTIAVPRARISCARRARACVASSG